jgi:hypothetical protein
MRGGAEFIGDTVFYRGKHRKEEEVWHRPLV